MKIALVLLAACLLPALASAQAAAAKPDPGPTALVVIDIQNFYFPGGRMALVDPLPASLQAKRLLERFHPNVLPAPGETVIGKHHANAFRDTGLLDVLRKAGAKRLVIAGMQTHMCVEAATRHAADLGFEAVVVHDACATRALAFGGVEVPAAQVHAAALAAMNGSYARVVSTDELLAELK